jgi:hypothetical protein
MANVFLLERYSPLKYKVKSSVNILQGDFTEMMPLPTPWETFFFLNEPKATSCYFKTIIKPINAIVNKVSQKHILKLLLVIRANIRFFSLAKFS